MCTTCSECVADVYVGVKTHLCNIHTHLCTSAHNTCKVQIKLTTKKTYIDIYLHTYVYAHTHTRTHTHTHTYTRTHTHTHKRGALTKAMLLSIVNWFPRSILATFTAVSGYGIQQVDILKSQCCSVLQQEDILKIQLATTRKLRPDYIADF